MIFTYSLESSSSINFVLYPACALCLPSVAPSNTAGTLSFCFLYRFLPSLSLPLLLRTSLILRLLGLEPYHYLPSSPSPPLLLYYRHRSRHAQQFLLSFLLSRPVIPILYLAPRSRKSFVPSLPGLLLTLPSLFSGTIGPHFARTLKSHFRSVISSILSSILLL